MPDAQGSDGAAEDADAMTIEAERSAEVSGLTARV